MRTVTAKPCASDAAIHAAVRDVLMIRADSGGVLCLHTDGTEVQDSFIAYLTTGQNGLDRRAQ